MTTSSAPHGGVSSHPGAPRGENESAAPRPAPAEPSPPALGTGRLLVTLSALLLSVVSFAAAGIAVPDIGASLGATAAEQSLVVSVYALGFAVPMVLGGRLGDLYGRRRLFLAGMAGFSLFSLAATLAPDIAVLTAARALTGMSAAAMVPQVLATITATTQGRERARAVALFGATAGGATAIGQVLGGMSLSVSLLGAPWRTVFAMSALLGALAFGAALRWLPDTSAPGHRSLDLVGTVLLGLALMALMLPVSQGGALGWPAWCWASLGATPVLFRTFWWWQRRLHRGDRVPLVPPPLFRLGSYRIGLLMAWMLQSAFGAFTFLYALSTQTGLGWSAMRAALVLLPFSLVFLTVSIWSGRLAPRFGFRRLLAVGGLVQATLLSATAASVFLRDDGLDSWVFATLLVGVGVGQALMFGPLVGAMIADVPPVIAGAASGVLQTTQQAAMGLGIAVAGGVLSASLNGSTAATAQSYTHALAVCMCVQAVFAVAFAGCALSLPRR
ncbi:Major Facilitator Superfamily protein [Streptomyces zhaozhouensis]|uniref:Major Facilitator Superfamily protein n=1 Tax=Streptomyces zhaozhouensis TaxID=1300267 RepID=A0A286DTU8_9ACTN|nr:MFS transporter [Streptomyces zhaozhouensis]SOD62061.1 Major Facilitator Superfamily protein [Streptomyces zhaozhouensis]